MAYCPFKNQSKKLSAKHGSKLALFWKTPKLSIDYH